MQVQYVSIQALKSEVKNLIAVADRNKLLVDFEKKQ